MSPAPSLSSSPTLPLPVTLDPLASLPDLSSVDESEARTEIMPQRAWLSHLSSAGERPAAAPHLLEDGEYVWLDEAPAGIDEATDPDVVRVEPKLHAERVYVPPTIAEPAPPEAPRVTRRKLPPLRVWLAVVVLGAGIGSVGGLTAATATAPTPAVCPEPPPSISAEPVSDVAATSALVTKAVPDETPPAQAPPMPAAAAPHVAKAAPGNKTKAAPKRHSPR